MEGVMENWMENWTNARLCDVANLVLGAFLFVSPWIFGFDAGKASGNANIAGIIIAVLAIAALAAFAVWEEWLNLLVGLWTLVSPWLLGFQGTSAMTVHVIIAEIIGTGATADELAEAQAWLVNDEPLLNAGKPLASGRVRELIDILAEFEPSDDDDKEAGPVADSI